MTFFSGRKEAASSTPPANNVETVSFDDLEDNKSVKLGYHYKGAAEQKEKRKNALYGGAADRRELS